MDLEFIMVPEAPALGGFSRVASEPLAWQAGLFGGGLLAHLPAWLLPPALRAGQQNHQLPAWPGGACRRWRQQREATR